jgi:Zn-dependent peptidase ImmA (M78 family)
MKVGKIAALRDMVPIRPLDRIEAMRIAELQAKRLLELSDVTAPPVPESVIANLPFIQVERFASLPVSGAARWASQRWVILLNSSESYGRQRFSLAHELKHILDHRFAEVIYSSIPMSEQQHSIERICDYFAGCLLMPRSWLLHASMSGNRSTRDLATRFETSEVAIRVRLQQIGVDYAARDRCASGPSTWSSPNSITRYRYSRRHRRPSRIPTERQLHEQRN